MPARQFPPPPEPLPLLHHHHRRRYIPLLVGGVIAAIFSLLLLLVVFVVCVRKFSRKRTVPSSDSKPPHRFSYNDLRRATSSFSPSHRLGQGGFGSVFRGTLGHHNSKIEVAVKLMDSGSLQGEREFQTELFFAGKIDSNYVVSILGFSSDRKRQRLLLVYELMSNGSLQNCLFQRKCAELLDWKQRFAVILDVAKGLEYLHHYCDPPIIHGDIKPSNVLLDQNFNAKIGDLGLAKLKSEDPCEVAAKNKCSIWGVVEDNGSVIEETESVTTAAGVEDFSVGVYQPPNNCLAVMVAGVSPETVVTVEASPETIDAIVVSPRTVAAMASPTEGMEKTNVSEGNFDGVSVGSGKELANSDEKRNRTRTKSLSGKDWWWKQDGGGAESGRVKDYVMQWIGNEIGMKRLKNDWTGSASSSGPVLKSERKTNRRRLDWWVSLDENKSVKKEKRRPPREWWKEEYCEELAKKTRKKKKKNQGKGSISDGIDSDSWWPRDEDFYANNRKKKRCRSRSSLGSVDWWLDGLSGDLWRTRRNSCDSASGEIPKSGGISSTPSMRGTVCYVAPEYSGDGDLSERCDVYSFGVLLLVIVAGRRPLQVTNSPMSDFQRANLLSWARHLARAGKLLDLVDQSIQLLDKEQALLCITVALLCLQKSPARRPSMKVVVGMLSGELEPPQLPVQFSPSPPSCFPLKSQKRVRFCHVETFNPKQSTGERTNRYKEASDYYTLQETIGVDDSWEE